MKPDRVVIGVEENDERAAALMKELYGPFTRTGAPILTMRHGERRAVQSTRRTRSWRRGSRS